MTMNFFLRSIRFVSIDLLYYDLSHDVRLQSAECVNHLDINLKQSYVQCYTNNTYQENFFITFKCIVITMLLYY